MRKSLLTILLLLSLVLAACGGAEPAPEPDPEPEATEAPADEPEEEPEPEPTDEPEPTAEPEVVEELECDDEIGCVEIDADDPVNIAYMLTTSGATAFLGEDSVGGIEIAIDDRGGELLGHAIELNGEDSLCSAEGGQTASQKVAADDTILGVIGTNCSSAAAAAMPILSEAGLVLISPSNTAPTLTSPDTGAGGTYLAGYFRTAHNDLFQGRVAAEFVYNELGARTVATVHDGSPYADGLQAVFADVIEELGGEVTFQGAVNVGDTDMRPILTEIASNAPDVLYFPIFEPEAPLIAAQSAEITGLEDTILMSADGALVDGFAANAGAAGEGMYMSGPYIVPEGAYGDLLTKWDEKYGGAPPSGFHGHAYDATNMLLDSIEAVAQVDADGNLLVGRQAVRDAMTAIADYSGVTGMLGCNETGDCATGEALGIYQITDAEISDGNWPPAVVYTPAGGMAEGAAMEETDAGGEAEVVDELVCEDDIGCIEVDAGDPVNIAYMLTTSGATAFLGEDSVGGIEIAIDDRGGEVLGHEIELNGEDSLCSAEGGQTASQKVAADDTIAGVIGTNCSSAAAAAMPILSEAGLVLISPSNTAPTLTSMDTGAGGTYLPGYFRTAHNDLFQGRVAAEFVYNELGATTVATIHDGSPYADGLQAVFADVIEELGGEVTFQGAVNVGDTDMRPILTEIASNPPDVLYFPIFEPEAPLIAAQSAEIAGLEDTILMSADGALVDGFAANAGAAGEGMYMSGPYISPEGPYGDLLTKWDEKYGGAPPSGFHGHAYDATNMLIDSIEAVAQMDADGNLMIGRQALRDALTAISGYAGVTGTLGCDETGDCATGDALGIYQITDAEISDGNWPPAVIYTPAGGMVDGAMMEEEGGEEAAAPEVVDELVCEDDIGCVEVDAGDPVNVAYMLTTSGATAFLGEDSVGGIEIAIDDFGGELLGHEIDLSGEDSLCSAEGGQTAAQKVAADDTIVGVIGTNCSSAATAGLPILSEAGLVLISPSNTAPTLTSDDTAGGGVWLPGYYRTAHNDLFQGRVAAEFVYNELGARTVATVHDGSPYADGLQQVFADVIVELGGEVTFQGAVNVGDTDMRPILTEIAANAPDVLYFPNFEPEVPLMAAQSTEIDGLEDTILMSADGALVESFPENAGDAANGMYMSGPYIAPEGAYGDLLAKWDEKYGGTPPSGFHGHAYDAMMMLLNSIESVAQMDADGNLMIGRQALRDALTAIDGYAGTIGTLSCNETGDCATGEALGIYQVTDAEISDDNWPPAVIYTPAGGMVDGAMMEEEGGEEAAAPEVVDELVCEDDIGCVEVDAGDPVNMAYMLTTSGATAFLGEDSVGGIEIAIDDFGGELLGHEIDLSGEDSLCSAEGGQTAAQKVAADDTIVGVIGTNCSSAATAGLPILSEAGLVLISPSNTAPTLTSDDTAGGGVWLPGYYRTAHNDLFQGRVAAEFVYNELGARTVATVHDGSPYADGLQQVFADVIVELGGEVTFQGAVNVGDTDMRPILTEIAANAPDVLYFPNFEPEVPLMAAQSTEIDGLEDTILMSADGALVESFPENAGDAANGMYMSGPYIAPEGAYGDLLAKWDEKYGGTPPSGFHGHAYDATMMLLNSIESVAQMDADGNLMIGRQALRDALTAIDGYAGTIGTLSCNETGDCATGEALGIYQVTDAEISDDNWPPAVIYTPAGGMVDGAMMEEEAGEEEAAAEEEVMVATGDDLVCEDEIGCVEIEPGDPVNMAYMLVTSGAVAFLGEDSVGGIEIAIDDFGGEVVGHEIELSGEDSLCSAEGGQTAAQKVAADDTIVGVIGTNCSSAATAALPILSEAGLILISPSNTAPTLTSGDTAAGGVWVPGYYRTAHNDLFQGRVAAEFVYNELGARTVATVHDGSPYADGLQQVFADVIEELGGEVTFQGAVNVGDTDMRPILTEIAANAPDVLYFPIFEPEAPLMVAQSTEIGGLEDTILMGADAALVESFPENAGDAAEGMYLSGPYVAPEGAYGDLLAKWDEKYGGAPPSGFHGHAYDATVMLLQAIEAAAQKAEDGSVLIGRQALRDALTATADFEGTTGILTCNATGDCATGEALGIFQITPAEINDDNWPAEAIYTP